MAVKAGADALGLVSAVPSGPGVISERKVAEIAATVPSAVATFLLTCETEPSRIVEQHRICKTSTIQFVDYVDVDAYKALRTALPGIRTCRSRNWAAQAECTTGRSAGKS